MASDPPPLAEGGSPERQRGKVARLARILVGAPRNPLDPRIFHKLSLAAFLAWVGLGVDGLSSSAYGPEEAFRALGDYRHLALLLAVMMAATIGIISASYAQIIENFPTGGGGYVVATKLLGSYAGVISGCALVFDYVLTIAVSIASGADAVFSLLPPETAGGWKVPFCFLALAVLIVMNMRGVKESVAVLMPVFLTFLVTHGLVVLVGIFGNLSHLAENVGLAVEEIDTGLGTLGFWGLFIVFMRAYALGGGTYTGIEAVSNGLAVLKEPRVATAKRTMLYMAVSLAFVAGGILVCYLLTGVEPQEGRTLNAVLLETVAGSWTIGGLPIGRWFRTVALLSTTALLFAAAQTGFLGGPGVLSNMALDGWVPKRFAHISERLVVKNGIVLMGVTAGLTLFYSGASVHILVVMYSINVFLTFTLSQAAMCWHWVRERRAGRRWKHGLSINGVGLVLTGIILVVTAVVKFKEGAWITLVITACFVVLCLRIRGHYRSIRSLLRRLDADLMEVPAGAPPADAEERARLMDRGAPTAVMLVSGYSGLGLHSFLAVHNLFPGHFKNFVFISVGVIDTGNFKGVQEIVNLERNTIETLDKYVQYARSLGFNATSRHALGTLMVPEMRNLCAQVRKEFPRAVFFAGRLIFREEKFYHRWLHNQSSATLQRRLQFDGVPLVILPIRVL
ncbi:MAG TPA: APC family permease [Candidatus Polarisedimenticolia bacterium]|nr:APC family permease [Candidatus Polarisedimenticolia bacterium]